MIQVVRPQISFLEKCLYHVKRRRSLLGIDPDCVRPFLAVVV